MRKKFLIILTLIITILFFSVHAKTDPAMSVSVSTDGHYVVSGHVGRNADPSNPIGQLVLWDIEKKTKTVLSKNANAFSAMFIPDSHEFMWQDDKDIIYMQNVDGQVIKRFEHPFTVQNHRMTADKSFYLSADMWNHLYKGYENDITPIYTDGASISKPVDLSIVGDYFLSVTAPCSDPDSPVAETQLTANPINPSEYKKNSYDGVILWNKNTLKPVAKLNGNCGATNGLISPDGKWVITGGENGAYYMWEINNLNNRLSLAFQDEYIKNENIKKYDKNEVLYIPKEIEERGISMGKVAYAFITETEFIGLGKSENKDGDGNEFASLFTIGNPWVKGYVEIGNNPSISTNYFQRNLSVSSSPKAHILVTGQATGGGINVYKYHPEKMELEKIWVAD
ncbi:WD40 repeat domain-containing protein [uncultured Haemophilus sp.]|uniref:WD40 repeat domain-containing protein n=1 Tax=uncultured Haemophilus sp. TaxID=237779 RepID=UPI0027DD642C|nr:WD40 repeat domain-containing protein [uncultured Haemophilus sp.]